MSSPTLNFCCAAAAREKTIIVVPKNAPPRNEMNSRRINSVDRGLNDMMNNSTLARGRYVHHWHLADVTIAPRNVRFRPKADSGNLPNMIAQKWNLYSCPLKAPPNAKVIVCVAWSAATVGR
jgi:hypothetical protein